MFYGVFFKKSFTENSQICALFVLIKKYPCKEFGGKPRAMLFPSFDYFILKHNVSEYHLHVYMIALQH